MKKTMSKEGKKIDNSATFDPPIKSRFLPGEVDPIVDKIDFKCYKKHRLRCANIKPKVDNKAPKFDMDTYYDHEKLKNDSRLAKVVHIQNLHLAKKLNKVYRLGGKVDCWNLKDKKLRVDQTLEEKVNKRIMKDNKALFCAVNCLPVSEYAPQVHAKAWKVLKEQIEEKQRFPWPKEPFRYPSITKFAIAPKNEENTRRPRCFFDLEFKQTKLPLGRVVFELYNDYVPSICANFEAFCKGHKGMSYKGTPFHRIVSGYWCQGGDVTKFNGLGGASIYNDDDVETPSEDENHSLRHTCPGVLSTYYDEKQAIDSKFNLTFQPLKTMDDKKIVFGKVIKGMDNVFKVSAYGTKFGKPLREIAVSNCGVLMSKKRGTKGHSDSSEGDTSGSSNSKLLENNNEE